MAAECDVAYVANLTKQHQLAAGEKMSGQYIPAGRTSIVKRGKSEYQLQTEYARLPHPRITTTIFSQGQVLHKVEKSLDQEIESIEHMHRVEEVIKAQHLEISKIIRERGLPTTPPPPRDPAQARLRSDRIGQLDGVERVYLITGDGKIVGSQETTKQFQKLFKHVFKELPEMLKVFAALPGSGNRREEGIYEVEPGRILMASTGVEFYLILIRPESNYETLAGQLAAILRGE